ncbi:MAG: hypothetical protein OES32_12760 [Acidobacteriota bacterium]|nr:hypothetical protein [Acidobacteriota bacterium]MDH3524448.1 hypothetical protein [Acidobacteriota bacterium]
MKEPTESRRRSRHSDARGGLDRLLRPVRGGSSGWRRVVLLWLAAALVGDGLSAQRFGQWWWDGSLGLGQRGTENLRDGRRLSDFEQQELRTSLGLNGFVIHPAVGRFRLGLDLLLTELEGGRDLDTDNTGASAEFSFFPRGSYPFSFFYRRQLYDYAGPAGEEPVDLRGAVENSEQWGGRLRLRRGPLRGTQVGWNHAAYDFLDAEARREIQNREFVDWTRSGARMRQRLRLEHRLRRYGTVDLEIEDVTLNVEQNGELTEAWRWQLSGVGIQRQVGVGSDVERTTDDYRLRTRLYRPLRERDQLDFGGSLGWTRPQGSPSVESAAWSLAYRWRPRGGLEVAPFLRYARQAGGDLEVSSPRAGVSMSWSRSRETLDWLLGSDVSYGVLESRDGGESRDESRTGYSIRASLGHGDARRLRKELEIEAGRNELRLSRADLLTELPDLGLPAAALGDEDFYRSRVSLSHRWDSKWLSGWGEASRREASNDLGETSFESETLTAALQFGGRSANIRVTAGDTRVKQESRGDQDLRFVGVGARWRPWRYLSLSGSYRQDKREIVLAPDIDGARAELALEVRVGQTLVQGGFFETEERLADGGKRTNRGVRWSVGRRLAGWLPIVTGTQRRGVIR